MLGLLQYLQDDGSVVKAFGFDSEVQKGGPGSGPQGGNSEDKTQQGLTQKAQDATDRANESGKHSDHVDASNAHKDAAINAQRIGAQSTSSGHSMAAAYHAGAAIRAENTGTRK